MRARRRDIAVAGLGALGLMAALWPSSASASTVSRSTSLEGLRAEYLATWDAATIRPERLAAVGRIVDTLASHRDRYVAVERATGVPWHVVAALHSLEGGGSSGRFTGHLHNGDALTARTVHVPAGRPVAPPANGVAYSWEESASDALARFRSWRDWSLAATLWQLERYNGFGTRSRGFATPYLWSFTTAYSRGKFVRDGVWDGAAVSAQAGAAALFKVMESRGLVGLAR